MTDGSDAHPMGAEVAGSTPTGDTALQPSPSLLCGARRQNRGVSAPGWAEGGGSVALPAICSLPPLNKVTQSPLIAFNHFPINSPRSRALFKAYGLESIFTKTIYCSRRWKLGGSNEKKEQS